MSNASNSRSPSLLAILLVTQGRTGSGAQIIFHYPPDPLVAACAASVSQDANDDEAESSSSDSESSSEEEDFELFTKRINSDLTASQEVRSQNSDEEEDHYSAKRSVKGKGEWKPPWEPLLGLGEDGLVSLLAPGRAWHKRRFELGINEMVFLGRPVYAREDGFWRRPKPRKPKLPEDGEDQPTSETAVSDSADENTTDDLQEALVQQKSMKDRSREPSKSQLTMFHLVFVMDPPPLEHTLRVKEMYDHVVRKFSKVLKYEQSHYDYVWKQSELLQSIKSAHIHQKSPVATLYTEMARRSSLATAIARIFDNISASRIAAVSLGPNTSVSLQVPPVTSTSYLPSLSEPPLEPGLWLTTATDPISTASDMDSAAVTGALQLSKNFSLLLKSNPQKILKDIQAAGGPLANPLASFVAQSKPTKSFYKMSIASQTPLTDIQHLARHLVYWRRAVAIPPLHQRDTYIVSPNADMSKLASACKTYETTFPMMPSLPKMLNSLSGTPIPYGSLIPSSDHKEEYYRVLAWLMRDGWVTQLRTFAYVRVDPEVKKTVRERDREESRGVKTPIEKKSPYLSENERELFRSLSSSAAHPYTPGIHPANPASSPFKRPSVISRPSSDGRQSISTDHTSIRGRQLTHNPKAASLILSPPRASPEESRWLACIASRFAASSTESSRTDLSSTPSSEVESAEIRRHWPQFVKYFNGTEALQRIAVREGLKRKFVWNMLTKMGLNYDEAVEDEKGENHKTLVTIRHW
ncbi:uncharacterized protein A1O9_07392 [Exophiala aquamarina CBS 119918]|uniref:Nitrogen permease regulator 3 n=1 Tax=Exophiala aquamarina CBS 119918 TaxID=1182545 RepID=A0A072PBR1_9EURO|nr:uncharacterized protein A1O9_07392 [Exophiala aquamarina CBS 119918]KEF57202.1 hypothetical protein A1O9_07392 [Exophiala aquamarina CBS 119918]